MSSSNTLTYDQPTPHRPTLDELGGGGKLNALGRKPDPVTMIAAEDINQMSRQLESLAAMSPTARLLLSFSGGTPSLQLVDALSANLAVGRFAVTHNATGDTTIEWSEGINGALPARNGAPRASVAELVNATVGVAYITGPTGGPALQVKSWVAGTLTDVKLLIDIY